MPVREFCVSYNAADFESTVSFYVDTLNFTPSVSWDRSDGRGAFLVCEGNGVVEIFGAPRGETPYSPPPDDSFMIVIILDDVDRYLRMLEEKGVSVRWPLESFEWGKWFGVVDPNGVGIYFMQRLGKNVHIAKAALRQAVLFGATSKS